ncbi:hypothetical protein BC829DRAFT_172034 [Chytridium lagenaria]|nr:hypothetical protein BC829DRAFT_172034 [Chytridium lagenaria]
MTKTAGSPWTLNVKRLVEAMSPSRLIFGGVSPAKQFVTVSEETEVDIDIEVTKTPVADVEGEEEYEDYQTMEMEEGELLDDVDAVQSEMEQVMIESTGFLASLSDNRVFTLLKPVFDMLLYVLHYPKLLALTLMDWLVIPPLSLVANFFRWVVLNPYGRISLLSAIIASLLMATFNQGVIDEWAGMVSNQTTALPQFMSQIQSRVNGVKGDISSAFISSLPRFDVFRNITLEYSKVPGALLQKYNPLALFPQELPISSLYTTAGVSLYLSVQAGTLFRKTLNPPN